MAQQTNERTSWVLTVPYHASTDQVLGRDTVKKIHDQVIFGARGQFRARDAVRFVVENLSETVPVTTVSFEDSPDDTTYAAVANDQHFPAYPLPPLGRVAGVFQLNPGTLAAGIPLYLRALAHHTVVGEQGLIRLTLEKTGGGSHIEDYS